VHSPWQKGVAKRWVETVGRELLDHVIVLNERRLQRLLSEYVAYYHDDRTHLGLGKQTPALTDQALSGPRTLSSDAPTSDFSRVTGGTGDPVATIRASRTGDGVLARDTSVAWPETPLPRRALG
jgi:hypothetical protein